MCIIKACLIFCQWTACLFYLNLFIGLNTFIPFSLFLFWSDMYFVVWLPVCLFALSQASTTHRSPVPAKRPQLLRALNPIQSLSEAAAAHEDGKFNMRHKGRRHSCSRILKASPPKYRLLLHPNSGVSMRNFPSCISRRDKNTLLPWAHRL